MASAVGFSTILFSVIVISIGFTLYSGAFEALIYDTLKEEGRESIFDKIISNVNSIKLVAMSLAGLVSGFLYSINPRLPFALVGIVTLIAFILTFFLQEPAVDTEQFSIGTFISQSKQGVIELFKLIRNYWIAPLMLIGGALWVISDQMLESILSIEFGFSEKTIGPFFALLFLVAAVASQLTPWMRRKLGDTKAILVLIFGMVLTYLTSPFVGMVVGGIMLILRESMCRNFHNITDVFINDKTQSKYRATVISTYNMFKNIPYMLAAFWLGRLMDVYSARTFSFYLGVIMIVGTISYTFVYKSILKNKVVGI